MDKNEVRESFLHALRQMTWPSKVDVMDAFDAAMLIARESINNEMRDHLDGKEIDLDPDHLVLPYDDAVCESRVYAADEVTEGLRAICALEEESIKRGLSQRGTIARGSFAEFATTEATQDGEVVELAEKLSPTREELAESLRWTLGVIRANQPMSSSVKRQEADYRLARYDAIHSPEPGGDK